MTDGDAAPIRLCEWGKARADALSDHQRAALADAAERWRAEHRLNAAPLAWEGADGKTLRARQWVGVVEAAGATIEILPKLDAHLLTADAPPGADTPRVMRSLLWLLEASGYGDAVPADTGPLADDAPARFLDLFALLLGRGLRAELMRGVRRRYEAHEDDLPAVRGRIRVGVQAARHFGRADKIACAWDEFTPDTPMNRLLRCACVRLRPRVADPAARRLLADCAALLDDVTDVAPAHALRETAALRHWDRADARFRRPFRLARRLLAGLAHASEHGASDTFVFLLDMNAVFEAFVSAALSDAFGTMVETQKPLGRLLDLPRGGVAQYADHYWRGADGATWIGDAKYKHLAAGGDNALRFADLPEAERTDDARDDAGPLAGRVLSPADVRQLTVYAELARRRDTDGPAPRLALLYPFVGGGRFAADAATAWNGSPLFLVPVRVARPPSGRAGDALPSLPGTAPV